MADVLAWGGAWRPTLKTSHESLKQTARQSAGSIARGVSVDTPTKQPHGSADGLSEGSPDVWATWPSVWIDRQGMISQPHADVLAVIGPVLKAQTAQLETSANRRLWSLVDQDTATLQWKVLDPVQWPFIGIIGWSTQSPSRLQLAAWNVTCLPWQVDDAWRKLLAATAAVKARRRRHVA